MPACTAAQSGFIQHYGTTKNAGKSTLFKLLVHELNAVIGIG
jgi:hypothetical protein